MSILAQVPIGSMKHPCSRLSVRRQVEISTSSFLDLRWSYGHCHGWNLEWLHTYIYIHRYFWHWLTEAASAAAFACPWIPTYINIPPHPPTPSYVVPEAWTSLYIHIMAIYNWERGIAAYRGIASPLFYATARYCIAVSTIRLESETKNDPH